MSRNYKFHNSIGWNFTTRYSRIVGSAVAGGNSTFLNNGKPLFTNLNGK
jgi:hypothetical protein